MNGVKRNLQESIVLQNVLIGILPKMVRKNDRQLFKFFREYSRENVSVGTEFMAKEVAVNLLKELFTLINQIWAIDAHRFDEGLSNEKNLLKIIKSNITKDGQKFPFNNKELYKRIRESIVHNNKINPNFIYNLTNFELNLGEVNGSDYIINLDFIQIIQLIQVLVHNNTGAKLYAKIFVAKVDSITTRKEIQEYIKIYDNNDSPCIDLDKNQVERVYNYFKYIKNGENIIGNEDELRSCLRIPNEVERLFGEKLFALKVVYEMVSGATWQKLTTSHPNLLNKEGYVNFYFSLISNLLFTMASSQTNTELDEMLSGCINGLSSEDVRHLRNSLCHGRYFHDFNQNFYFYDGKKNLDFKLKLTIADINKILDKVANGQFEISALK